MSDLVLNELGDLDLSGGSLKLHSDRSSFVAQRLKIRLRTYLAEWFLDQRIGVPYFQEIFKKGVSKNAVDAIMSGQISLDQDVASLLSFSSEIINNQYRLRARILLRGGEPLEILNSFKL